MCWKKRKPVEYPLTDRQLTIHGRVYDVPVKANLAGEPIPRPYTGKGMVIITYHDGVAWRRVGEAEINAPDNLKLDGLFTCLVALGYGQYRLTFTLAGHFLGGRFGAFCYAGLLEQDTGVCAFRLKRGDIVQQAAVPQLSGDIIVYIEG